MKYYISVFALVCTLSIFVIVRLSDFDLSDYSEQRSITFRHNHDVLQGTLILPSNKKKPPVVLIVHGDAAQDRWSSSGYIPVVKFLIDHGIGVFSWDKPGVGESKGNWLEQTMSDRAWEAVYAFRKIREQPELKGSQIGFLGFSQAGWVVPEASRLVSPDFAILVGAAINWRNQSLYYTQKRLEAEGLRFTDIQSAIKREAEDFDKQFTSDAATHACQSVCNRQDFERRNSLADATNEISGVHVPVMILMGDDDRNVNADETIAVWAQTLPIETKRCIKKIPGATHGLLRSKWFDYQLPSQFPLWKQALFLLLGKYAYSPNALSGFSSWIINKNCD